MVAFERHDPEVDKKVLVVINTSDLKQSETSATQSGGSEMMTSFAPGTQLVDVLAQAGDPTATMTVGAAGALTVQVPKRGMPDNPGARILVPSTDVVELP